MKPINLCTPALIYAIFSIMQIFFDLYGCQYILSVSKLIISIIFTYLLNLLCTKGLSIISWILIFIPFIFTLIFIEILLVSMSVNVLGNEIINKIESTNTNTNNHVKYIDISYSEVPHFNDNSNINDMDMDIDIDNLFD